MSSVPSLRLQLHEALQEWAAGQRSEGMPPIESDVGSAIELFSHDSSPLVNYDGVSPLTSGPLSPSLSAALESSSHCSPQRAFLDGLSFALTLSHLVSQRNDDSISSPRLEKSSCADASTQLTTIRGIILSSHVLEKCALRRSICRLQSRIAELRDTVDCLARELVKQVVSPAPAALIKTLEEKTLNKDNSKRNGSISAHIAVSDLLGVWERLKESPSNTLRPEPADLLRRWRELTTGLDSLTGFAAHGDQRTALQPAPPGQMAASSIFLCRRCREDGRRHVGYDREAQKCLVSSVFVKPTQQPRVFEAEPSTPPSNSVEGVKANCYLERRTSPRLPPVYSTLACTSRHQPRGAYRAASPPRWMTGPALGSPRLAHVATTRFWEESGKGTHTAGRRGLLPEI